MNCNIYFFIVTHKGYSQYPDNYSKDIILNILATTDGKKDISQLTISQKGKLAYVTYLFWYAESKSFGICCEYNGVVPTNVEYLLDFYDKILNEILERGELLHYNSAGRIVSDVGEICERIDIFNYYNAYILNRLLDKDAGFKPIPTHSFISKKDDKIKLAIKDAQCKLVDYLCTYDNVIICRENPYVKGVEKVLVESCERISKLETELTRLNNQKKQYKLVVFLGIIVFVFGTVLWNKVLFPSVVTHHETGEFVYYGPMKNKKPHGVGVAIYPVDDKDGRKYYIGEFVDGERDDNDAILFYKTGSYFYGKMEGDEWKDGIFYRCSDGTFYKGTFKDNLPFNGSWYGHNKNYDVHNGKHHVEVSE